MQQLPESVEQGSSMFKFLLVEKDNEEHANFGFSDLKKESRIETELLIFDPLRDKDRIYIIVESGLNLKGTCNNQNCVGFGKQVWVSLGYGKFDINRYRFHQICPCCKQKMPQAKFTSFGYLRACVSMKGMKILPDDVQEQFEFEDKTDGDKFVKFKDFDGNMNQWGYLDVEVTKMI